MFFLLITSLRRARRERSDGIDDRRRAEKGQVANNNAQGVEKLRRHKAQQSVGSGGGPHEATRLQGPRALCFGNSDGSPT